MWMGRKNGSTWRSHSLAMLETDATGYEYMQRTDCDHHATAKPARYGYRGQVWLFPLLRATPSSDYPINFAAACKGCYFFWFARYMHRMAIVYFAYYSWTNTKLHFFFKPEIECSTKTLTRPSKPQRGTQWKRAYSPPTQAKILSFYAGTRDETSASS